MVKKFKFGKFCVNLSFVLLCLAVAVPFLIIIGSSFQDKAGFLKNGYTLLPKDISFSAYAYIFHQPGQLLNSYMVTIFVTTVGTVLGMTMMTMLAYVISRDDYPYKNIVSFFIYFTMLFSGGMVANYIWVAKYLNMSNSIWSLILPLLMSPFNIFILRTSCKAIPGALIESAKLDGASEIYIFIKIVVPLSVTGIATVALMTIFTYWNSWFQSMLYINDNSYVSLHYYLIQLLEGASDELAAMDTTSASMISKEAFKMALCTLAVLPMLFVFSFLQKYFVKGITVGSVKG